MPFWQHSPTWSYLPSLRVLAVSQSILLEWVTSISRFCIFAKATKAYDLTCPSIDQYCLFHISAQSFKIYINHVEDIDCAAKSLYSFSGAIDCPLIFSAKMEIYSLTSLELALLQFCDTESSYLASFWSNINSISFTYSVSTSFSWKVNNFLAGGGEW